MMYSLVEHGTSANYKWNFLRSTNSLVTLNFCVIQVPKFFIVSLDFNFYSRDKKLLYGNLMKRQSSTNYK